MSSGTFLQRVSQKKHRRGNSPVDGARWGSFFFWWRNSWRALLQMTRPFARPLREKFRLRPAKPECSTRETHNPEYMTLPLRKGSNVPVEVTASPFTPFEAEGEVELFVGATNVTANEPLLIANFGKFSLAIPPSFPASKKIGTSSAWRSTASHELAACPSERCPDLAEEHFGAQCS